MLLRKIRFFRAALTAGLVLLHIPGRTQTSSQVTLQYNRYYDYPEVVEALRTLQARNPRFMRMESMGKSVQGRDMWVVILNNPDTGNEPDKPAMYIDANIHGNEVQGTEVILYTIDYLLHNYGKLDRVTELLDHRVFYLIPMVNPDGRAHWFDREHMKGHTRTGMQPLDNDNDGLLDEDGYDDLDGDGQIFQMRKKVSYGSYRKNREDPRLMERVPPGENGDYDLLGSEGIDNDGDGWINEDGPGGYDMNRNWPADWQPPYVQYGAGNYPLCYPETRSIAEFIMAHPNIAGVQSYHNSGGMILRAPGSKDREKFSQEDLRVYDYIGKKGEEMLPFYRYLILWKDLYTVHGGFVNWTSEDLGIFSFTNELWSSLQYFNKPRQTVPGEDRYRAYTRRQIERLKFDDLVEMGARYSDWKPFRHPDFGEIEIGGWVRETNRVPPLFMLEELCHRNTVFTLFHADQMPKVAIDSVEVVSLDKNLFQVRVTVSNERVIPTISAQARKNRLFRPDILEIQGKGLRVVSAGHVQNRWLDRVDLVDKRPARILLPEGIPGNRSRTVQFVIAGKGEGKILLDCVKGGKTIQKFVLK
jgi:hypothetical protein